MDERLRICVWMVGVGCFSSVLGGVFGAVTAALYAYSGGAAGTHLARSVVEYFLQGGERQPSPIRRAALIGAVDGFFFLGALGLVTGTLLGVSGQTADELLLPMLLGEVFLIGGAILFGTLAYALTYRPAEWQYCIAGLSVGGSLAGVFTFFAPNYAPILCPIFLAAGAMIGLALGRVVRAYSPKFHPPRAEKTTLQPRSDANTDITGSSSSPPNADFFRKPDSIEEG